MNDLENIPSALVLFWGAGIVSRTYSAQVVVIVGVCLFTVSRILYSLVFAFSL